MDTYVGSVSSRLVSIDKLWRLLTPLCHVLPTDQSTSCCCFLWFFCWERTCDQCWNVDFANTFCHLKCRNNHQHDCGHLRKEEEGEHFDVLDQVDVMPTRIKGKRKGRCFSSFAVQATQSGPLIHVEIALEHCIFASLRTRTLWWIHARVRVC